MIVALLEDIVESLFKAWHWLGENSDQFIALSAITAAFSFVKRFIWDERTRFKVFVYFKEDEGAQAVMHVKIRNQSYFDIAIKSIDFNFREEERQHQGYFSLKKRYNEKQIRVFEVDGEIIKAKRIREFVVPKDHDKKVKFFSIILHKPEIRVKVKADDGTVKTSNRTKRPFKPGEWNRLFEYVQVQDVIDG